MHRVHASHLTGGVCDGAGGVGLRHRLGGALITFGLAFDVDIHLDRPHAPARSASTAEQFLTLSVGKLRYYSHLPIVTSCPTFHQRDPGRQTDSVHMPPGVQVVQTAEDEVEAGKIVYIKLGIFDIGMVGHYRCFRAKP